MKRIHTFRRFTIGLARYLAHGGDASDWSKFQQDDHEAYLELSDAIDKSQHGLCAYCEINLIDNDRQVEHVIPRSDPDLGKINALNPANLLACCKGGTAGNFFDCHALEPNTERFLPPAKRNQSCGQAKGNLRSADFIDPRKLYRFRSLLCVRIDGVMDADEAVCREIGVSVDRVKRTIDMLGLNAERLRLSRQHRWHTLSENWGSYLNDPDIMVEAAREELFPDREGALRKFFTTSRSFFAPWCETIMSESPQRWI